MLIAVSLITAQTNPVLLTALHMLTQKNPSNSTQNHTHDQVQQKPPKNPAHATHSNPGDESKNATAPDNSSSAQETQSTDSSETQSYASSSSTISLTVLGAVLLGFK
eukprot:NODE_828_length_3655_cov_0.833802.p5 type:complete len:107 gc:universal NODE_828_length_3655_cov_0.833802:3021-2701(-)